MLQDLWGNISPTAGIWVLESPLKKGCLEVGGDRCEAGMTEREAFSPSI